MTAPRRLTLPTGLKRLIFRAPILLYRARLGWLLGHRFVLVQHRGRRSGRPRQVVVEVVTRDRSTGAVTVASGFGTGADWYRNLRADPEAVIWVSRRRTVVRATPLSAEDGGEAMVEYARRHPLAARVMARYMGFEIDGTEAGYRRVGHRVAYLRLEPVTTTDLVPAPYTCRALTPDDAQQVTDLMAVCELNDIGEVQIELEDIVSCWQRPSFDLASQSIGVLDVDGRLVAYAEVYQARRAEVYVHPRSRRHGIGTALMRWTQRVAREHGGSLVGQTVPGGLDDVIELFRSQGYRQLWTSWILELPPGAEIQAPALPPDTVIRACVPGPDEQAAYQVIEDAFGEWPDRDPVSYDDWAATVLRRPGFEPWQLLLAVERLPDGGEQVVGACFVSPSGDTGWVQELAVRRDRRGRGLARALLLRAFADTRARGATKAELATDSRTGALGVYEHVGMRVKQTFVHWAVELDGGHTA
ncbi:MAG: GNAT family N-acetyltransferase [Nocardioidaceae bacterium]